jgi:beta-glucosidase/6-phospho-beta-glucosidase/beta-galactosidase
MGPVHPASDSAEDRREADRFDLLFNRLYLEPLFNARYPERTSELLGVVAPGARRRSSGHRDADGLPRQ